MSEMQLVFMVVQEAPREPPSVIQVQALSGEAALARVPALAKDFFGGEVPKQMRTWRIERTDGPWTIFACEWSSPAGEIVASFRDVPVDVLVLLARYAGANDGVVSTLDSTRMLVDVSGGDVQCTREFPDACWEGVEPAKRSLVEFSYARAWVGGVEDVLNAKYRQRQTSTKKGKT